MILRVLVASLILVGTSASEQPSFLSAVRSLIYGDQTTNHTTRSINDGTPGLLPGPEESAYPDPPMTFNAYPAFTVGVTATTGSPCNLPQQIGTGPYRIPRWYFNPARMRCELFYWSGCCGNGNNFNTFQACQQVCEGNSNTVSPGSNFLNVQPSVQQPADWLRHRGTAISVTVEQVPVPQGMNNGNRPNCCTNQNQPRWYYERRSGMCQVYLYQGFAQSAGSNTFPSLEACQKACTPSDSSNHNLGPAPHIVLPAVETTHLGTGVSGDGFRFGQNNVNIGPIGVTTTIAPSQVPYVQPLPETMPPRQAPLFPVVVTTSARPATRLPQTAVDPCGQEREQGVGSLQLPRYFFNAESKLCEQFTYFGSGGNRNNFQTLDECRLQCPESPNPCAFGTVSSTPIQCAPGSVLSQTCSGQQFCHVGATPATTVCCNKPATNTDRCSQPLNIGIGNDNLQRWYFNPLTQQCQPCVYKGLQGNENNFISKADCENSCQINPCQRGLPYRSQGVTVQCSAANQAVCPAGYYCHVGADAATSLCCQALVSNPCNEVLAKGEGTSALTRFYYDAEKRQCLPFNYLGTKGNTNNFMTKESCEELCPVWVNPCYKGEPFLAANGKPTQCGMRQTCPTGFYCHIGYDDETTVCCQSHQNPCTALMAPGNGPHAMTRWFYDPSLRQCKQFMYKGLSGNENNFLLREHCEEACPVWQNPCPFGDPVLGASNRPQPCTPGASGTCPDSHWCHAGADAARTVCCPGKQDPCVLAVAEGVGNSVLPRFYFDLTVKQCKEFTYRGTRGNANNFVSREACELQCPVFVDPCPNVYAFSPSGSSALQYVRCSADTQQCPQSFWCHIGQSPDTTVCCPNAADPCTLPSKIPGEGTLKLTRWSYDPANRQCEPFEYAGLKGNQNNFLSREACETSCPVYENPCRSGEPLLVSGKPHLCRRDAPCPANYYCHIGTDEVKYCCPAVGTAAIRVDSRWIADAEMLT
uniref:Kunitz/Bovine pancreatic trypsin inhibitor domain protein n=1 Tax=Panagrellus redivivus TaxID=6233 RepID=A0A7E4WAT3_PANRE